MNALLNTYKTDVLIIGGGFAGMWAAKRLWELGREVLIVDKGPRDWGGLGGLSGGDMVTMHPGEDIHAWLDDFVYYFDGLCDQELVLKVLKDSYARFTDYQAMGHQYVQDEQGNYVRVPQRCLDHVIMNLSHPYGKGGSNLREELLRSINKTGIKRIGNVMITAVVKDGDRAAGAVGFYSRGGEPLFIEAKAVLMTTNSGGWKASYHMSSVASGAVELAFDAGARLRSYEFVQNWNVPKFFSWEGQTSLLPKGARFLNGKGEDFMERYSTAFGARSDPHYNVRGMALEVMAGRGPIYFDTSRMSPESVALLRPKAGWTKRNDDKLKALGIDFFNSQQEWMAQPLITLGGIEADGEGMTRVPGLFVAGRARSIDAGVYIGGWCMCTIAGTGYHAGESIVRYLDGRPDPSYDWDFARARVADDLGKLGKPGIAPKDVVRRLQEIMAPVDVSILKTGTGLNRSLEELIELQENVIPIMTAQDPHHLTKLAEARGVARLTEAYLRSSLTRKESRAGHYRADFPKRDDALGPHWVVAEKRDGHMVTSLSRVPVERYPIKPYRYYMDNFDFSA